MGVGERVVGTLDDREQGEFERHVAALELGDDIRQVALGSCENAIQVIGVPGKPLELGGGAVVVFVGQLEAASQLVQDIVRPGGRGGHLDARKR